MMKARASSTLFAAIVLGVDATTYPVGLSNCGVKSWVNEAPKRAVTMNQGTTEMMLGLGLVDRMVGTAYLDDAIWPEVEEDFNKIPILSDAYPDIDTLMSVDPDFLYASYRSAFQAKTPEHEERIDYFDVVEGESCSLLVSNTRGNYTYCREELHAEGIQTYLQSPHCELEEHRPDEVTLHTLYEEIWEIAMIFDAFDKALQLIDNIEAHFRAATKIVESSYSNSKPTVLWLDGWDPVSPFVGSCCGAVQAIIDYAGAINIYDQLGIEEKSSWDDGDWGEIVEKDPDVIVMIDASWDLAGKE
mmetsp:Transcript_26950/g.39713  ORF Transcript_26950/g.39713 Transcript_26950/m.39713 type:complete len:302 (+) Transcript_26950:298-1203(+)